MNALTYEQVKIWAYSTELDEYFSKYEDDEDTLEYELLEACTYKEIYEFIEDPACIRRWYLTQVLVPKLCHIFRVNFLPFEYSRDYGLIDKDKYIKTSHESLDLIYELADVVAEMRKSIDPVIKDIFKTIMDFRKQLEDKKHKSYYDLISEIFRRNETYMRDW